MPATPLDREEYIEQAYFFQAFRERLQQNVPTQEILRVLQEEILSTTKLPMAIGFLRGEVELKGKMGEAMQLLAHYFTPFQAFVYNKCEEDRSKFDHLTALLILQREAEYRTNHPTAAGLFIYQFESLARNRLGYDKGLLAMADDPFYDDNWRGWIRRLRGILGTLDFAEIVYYTSEQYAIDQRRNLGDPEAKLRGTPLFGASEGRIAKANRGKDPLYLFSALQRQLAYPVVPRPPRASTDEALSPIALNARLTALEKRVTLIDAEAKGQLDLEKFYEKPGASPSFLDMDSPTDGDIPS